MQHQHHPSGEHEHAHNDEQDDSHGNHQGLRGRGGFIISGLTGGHGVFHWFTQSFIAMLPEVQAAFALSGVGVGGITSIRELVSGIVTLPGGIIADALRKYWGLVLALCMAVFGVGWLIIGVAPNYYILLLGMAVVALAASIWHLPAMASLSHHFSHRKGTALSFHGVGGQLGDVLAPPVTGFLLAFLAWRGIISIYAVIPILLALLVYWAFKNIGRTGGDDGAERQGLQMQATKRVLRNPILWIVAFVGGIRGMAFIGLITFFIIFLNDLGLALDGKPFAVELTIPSLFSISLGEFEMTTFVRNLHFGLLLAVGIVSTPVVGWLSDIFGRKAVLVPGLLLLAVLSYLLGNSVPGLGLIVIIALMGTFLYGDQPILTALALDVAGDEVPTTVLGILSLERFLLSFASPLIAGALYDNGFAFGGIDLNGPQATFTYVAVLFLLGALILLFIPLPRPSHPADHH
ncbi:MAG: MFS transporter [Chloroflexi bacterium]|nr:MFS transporter [Chloroflexota bacterium]